MSGRWLQLRVLTRAAFARLFDAGTPGAHDQKTMFFWLLACLSAPGALIPFLLGQGSGTAPLVHGALPSSAWGWAMVARFQGVDALRALSFTDKTFYLGCAVAASALLTVVVWTRVLPDRRDALVLGPLPVRPATVVVSRLAALAAYVGATAVAMHALASIVFGVELAAGNTVVFALRGIVAHFVASCGAGAFVFLALAGVQGLLLVLVGPRVFARVAPAAQALVVALAMGAALAIPAISRAAAAALTAGTPVHSWVFWTPPFWFLGVYETVLGTSDPRLHGLAMTAGLALAGAMLLVASTYPIVYARVLRASLERPRTATRWTAAVLHAVAVRLSRDSRVRGVIELLLVTLTRGERHRLVMAASVGVALAWNVAAWTTRRSTPLLLPHAGALAMPLSTLFFLIAGMRLAAALPAGDRAAWLFDVSTPGARTGRDALERTMVSIVALPILVASTTAVCAAWGSAAALVHAAFLAAASAFVIELMLWRFTGIPCMQPWRPDVARLRRSWPAYVAGFFALTSGLAGVETLLLRIVLPSGRAVLPAAFSAWLVPGVIGGLIWAATAVRRAALAATPVIDDRSNLQILSESLQTGAERAGAFDDRSDDDDRRVARHASLAAGTLWDAAAPARRDSWLDDVRVRPSDLWRDARLALRRMRRSPAFAVFAIGTLALGIGATTTVYTIARALTTRPMAVRDASSLVTLQRANRTSDLAISWPDFQDLRRDARVFGDIEGWSEFDASLSGRHRATVVMGRMVTGSYFQLVGVEAMLGRTLQAADDHAGAPPVVVLSESAWRTAFDGDQAVIGRAIHLGGEPYVVVGVLSSSFRGVHVRTEQPAVWVPLAHPPLTDPALTAFRDPSRRDRAWLHVVARLRPGVRADEADRDVRRIADAIDAAVPATDAGVRTAAGRRLWTTVNIAQDLRAGAMAAARFAMLLLPAIVLLVACTNLSNLVLSRGAGRKGEMAIRRALGASRWSLVREQLVEHGLIALVGAAAGLALARAGIVYVTSFVLRVLGYAPQFQLDAHLDAPAVAVAIAAAGLAVLVAGLAPAIQLTRGTPAGLASATAAAPRWRGRAVLIALQVAASVALLLVAALSVRALFALDAGARVRMDLAPVGAIHLATSLRTHTDAEVDRLVAAIVDDIHRAPGIRAVAALSSVPDGSGTLVMTTTPDRPFGANVNATPAGVVDGTSDVFRVLGLPLVAGRAFDETDVAPAHPVAVVSEAEARAVFGTTNVVGRALLVVRGAGSRAGDGESAQSVRIIGVAEDAGLDVQGVPLRTVYLPFSQRPTADLRFLAPDTLVLARSTDRSAARASATLQAAVRRVDPDLAVTYVGPVQRLQGAPALAVLPLLARITGALALIALVLSMAGLYGVVSHVVAARTREMGIRVALGADRARILWLVFADGARPVAAGLVIGLVAAAVARMALQPLFGTVVRAIDPWAVLLALAPLVATAAIACWIPAARAARVDPNVALRDL
jgi:predicted permease